MEQKAPVVCVRCDTIVWYVSDTNVGVAPRSDARIQHGFLRLPPWDVSNELTVSVTDYVDWKVLREERKKWTTHQLDKKKILRRRPKPLQIVLLGFSIPLVWVLTKSGLSTFAYPWTDLRKYNRFNHFLHLLKIDDISYLFRITRMMHS